MAARLEVNELRVSYGPPFRLQLEPLRVAKNGADKLVELGDQSVESVTPNSRFIVALTAKRQDAVSALPQRAHGYSAT
jgi:hypothetical protein